MNEGWIVFEESSILNVKPLKLAKRTTLTSYSTSRRRLSVEIPPGRDGTLPSAPLRQTSSGELVANLPDRRDPPSSARIEVSKGKKPLLRPFLLGGRKKKGEMPVAAMHKSKREGGSDVHSSEKIVDDHLQVDLEIPEGPSEDLALTPNYHDGGEASPVWAPLVGKQGVSKRVAEMRIDEVVPSSPGISTSDITNVPLTPITPSTPVSPPIVNSPTPSPIPIPTTALIELTPLETSRPITPVPITPITPSLANTIPPSPIISTSSSPIPTTPTTTTKSSSRREPGHERDRDHHHHRKPNETSGERNKRKAREQARREDGSEGSRSRASQSEDVEEEDTWLEGIFEDLPFGPDKNMVSAPSFSSLLVPSLSLHLSSPRCTLLVPRPNTDTQSQAIESIKRDYKIFIAEIIALGGLAYVIQRSGW